LRHADAGDPEAWTWADAERPLSEKGERQAERLAEFLAARAFTADVVVTSPKVRARRTAEIVAGRAGLPVRVDDRLGGPLDASVVERMLGSLDDPARVVLVGHDPDFSELLSALVGAPRLAMRKGAFARLDVERPLRRGGATLRWLVPPDLLEAER
jgi:phosphohistidine phosphatase